MIQKQQEAVIDSSRTDEVGSVLPVEKTQIREGLICFEIQLPTLKIDPDKRIDRNIGKQARVVLIVTSCLFFFGFNRALIAAIVNSQTTKQFEKLFNFTGNVVTTKAFLSVMSPLGALCGTIFCSFLIKFHSPKQITRYGRSILFTASMFAIIFTITTMYTEIIILMIFRFGIGWTVGTFVAVIPSYIRDVTSKNIAPYFGTAPIINESLGGFISFILGFAIYEATDRVRQTWIIMCALNIIPLIIIIVCIKCDVIYESPMFLLKNNDRRQAEAIYQFIYQPQYVRAIMKEKELELLRFQFNQLRLLYNRSKNEIMRRKDVMIAVHLPTLRKMTGILVILLSSGSMMKSIHPEFERKAPILISLVFFISCFLSNVILKYLSRRAAFQLGTISICICNLALAIFYALELHAIIILVFKTIILIMYGLTFGPLVWPYLPEVVPARIIPLAQSMNWLIDCFTLSLPGVIIAHAGNPWPLFFVFFLWDFFSIFVNHFILVETKKKTMQEIIEKLDKVN